MITEQQQEYIKNRIREIGNYVSLNFREYKRGFSIVGYWLWFESSEIPSKEFREYLKSQGFRYNKNRKAWQNSFGFRCRKSEIDPRAYYPILKFEEEEVIA